MIRKVILIGFIGLLIALSNAMENIKIGPPTVTFKFNGKNLRQAIAITKPFYHFYPDKLSKTKIIDIFCPTSLPIYCAAAVNNDQNVCVSDYQKEFKELNNKSERVKFIFEETEAIGDHVFVDGHDFECERVPQDNLVDFKTFEGLNVFVGPGFNVINKSDKPESKVYCDATDYNNKTQRFKLPDLESDADEVKKKDYERIKKKLNVFASKIVFKEKKLYKSIKCFGVSTSYFKLVIILCVIGIAVGICYWCFWCEEDDDDEGDYSEEENENQITSP